jgi:hypothetical protein
MASTITQFIERIQFFDGERLFAEDLQYLEAFNREMRWLHNQTLHMWGVAAGYKVTGLKGDRQVTIEAGVAIDSLGREIVQTSTDVEPVPPVASDGNGKPQVFDLTVAYPDDSVLKTAETREGTCDPSPTAIRLREQPVFCWIDPAKQPSNDGLRIRLAQIKVLNCQLYEPVSIAQRQNALPATQPYVASGSTKELAKAPDWTATASDFGAVVSIAVDTRSAQFRTEPRYLANVTGDRSLSLDSGKTKRFLDGFVSLDKTDANGFVLAMLIPAALLGGLKLDDAGLKNLAGAISGWSVEWVGVEG